MSAAGSAVEQVRAGQPLLVETFAEWREAARELLVQGISPERITWGAPHADDLLAGGDLFTGAPPPATPPHKPPEPLTDAAAPETQPQQLRQPPHIPRSLEDMLQAAARRRGPDRWAVLY